MAVYADREHFIPIRCVDLIEVLASDRSVQFGQNMGDADRERFHQFAELLTAHYHREYYAHLQQLKNDYAPFDPDADTKTICDISSEEKATAQDRLFREFSNLLERANYKKMTRAEIEKEMHGASYWGIDMDVDWSVFERVELFHRGETVGQRTRRHWLKFWKKLEVAVPIWQRMVLIFKLKPHKRLGAGADTEHVFVKLFKDIPRMDLEMLLPGTRIKMRLTERGKLGASLFGSIAYVIWKLSTYSLAILKGGLLALYAPVALVLGYAYKTWAGFTTTKQTYALQLTQSLYYQNLDNNEGVIYRLLDEAEEQDVREALLAYFYLWRFAAEKPWTADELDDFVELDLERRLGIPVDFEIGDALDKLERLRFLIKEGEGYRTVTIEQAIRDLEATGSAPMTNLPCPAAETVQN
jgi:hypothetical protein